MIWDNKIISCVEKFKYIFVNDIEKDFNLSLRDELIKTKLYKTINANIGIDIDSFINVIQFLAIPQREIFDYCLRSCGYPMLCENVAYSVKEQCFNGYWESVKTYYNVYLREHEYSMVQYSKIARYILERKYPNIFLNEHFSDDIELPNLNISNENATMNNILLGNDNITLGEFMDIVNGKKSKKVSRFNFYDSFMSLKLGTINIHNTKYDYSLIIPYETLYKRDWDIVANYQVRSIIKPTANEKLGKDINNWFEGKQKDSPFWNMYDEINILKDLIKSL